MTFFVLLLIIQCFTVYHLFQLVSHNQLQPQELNQTVIQLPTQSTEYLNVADNLLILPPKFKFFLTFC